MAPGQKITRNSFKGKTPQLNSRIKVRSCSKLLKCSKSLQYRRRCIAKHIGRRISKLKSDQKKIKRHSKNIIQMVRPRKTTSVSDRSSQTVIALPLDQEQPSTSGISSISTSHTDFSSTNVQTTSSETNSEQASNSNVGNMGSALSSLADTSENESHNSAEERHVSRRRNRQRSNRAILEAYGGIPSSVPVKGESYCDCPKQGRDLACTCGEEDTVFDWCWDVDQKSAACDLSEERRTSVFHMSYSSGTAAVRGTQSMSDRQYFWEIKMTSPVYGTDMMVGIGTDNVKMGAYRHLFTSLLGRDGDSWGLSYYGRIQHKGQFEEIKGGKFGQGTIVGVHVDMWHGTLSYYKNRRPLGIAYRGLAGKTVYPMVASTAARTAMKVIKACSFQTSLQFLCCQVLRKLVPSNQNVINALDLPPGLRAFLDNNLSWLLRPSELERDPRQSLARKHSWRVSSSSSDEENDEDDEPQTKRLRVS